MHSESPCGLWKAMSYYVRDLPREDPIRSYLYGFLCHYSLDRTAHPFIYAGIGELGKEYPGRPEGYLHCMMESSLDVIILRYEREMLPTDFNLRQTVPADREIWNSIAKLYSFLLRELYGAKVEAKRLLQTLKDWRWLIGLANDRTTFKKAFLDDWEKRTKHYKYACLLRGISEDGDFDYANITNHAWQWPKAGGRSRTESFFDLYHASVRESVKFMKNFFGTENFARLTGEISFS